MTIVKKKYSFLRNRTPNEFIQELIASFNDQILEAYIFGSFNTNNFNADSDLDLLIITQTKLNYHERYTLFPELLLFFSSQQIPYDLIIYTPDEFIKLHEEGLHSKVGFWADFVKTSKLIYHRSQIN